MAGPWEKYAAPTPQSAPAGVLATIPKAVDPYKARDQQLQEEAAARAAEAASRAANKPTFIPQGATQMMDASGNIIPIPTAGGDSKDAIANAIKGLGVDELLTSVSRAKKNLGSWWSTGVPGAIAGNVPGSARNNLIGNLESLKGALIMEKLQALKDASKTGASGMGAMSEREGDRLAAAVASLSPDMSQDELETSLNLVEKHAQALKAISEGRAPASGGQDDVKAELDARIAAAKSPKDAAGIIAWLNSQNRPPSEDEIEAIFANIGNPNPDVRDPNRDPDGPLDTFVDQTGNIIAGGLQGLAALPDMAAKTAGQIMAAPVDALGFDQVADQLRNPFQFGEAIEQDAPTPAGTLSQVNRFGGQMLGGVMGFPAKAANAVVNRIVGEVPKKLPNAFAPRASETAAAGQRQGVDLLPADVGGEGIKAFTSAAAQAPLSRGRIVKTSRRASQQLDAAAARAADEAGDILPEDEAGQAARRGGNAFIKKVTDRASRWYDKAHEAAEGIKVMPQVAMQKIDEHIARKSQAGEISEDIVGELEKVKRSLAQQGGITVVGLREARTLLGSMARNDKLRGTDAKRIFGEVLDAASQDMAASLVQAGKPGAARLFQRADKIWRDRIVEIDEVLEPIIGKGKSGEDILKAVEAMARGGRGGVARLQRMLATLPPDEKGDVTATVIDRLGKARASAQDDVGGVFSSETFLTNWNLMSKKGKAALFGNSEVRRNLDDVARIAAARRETAALGSKSNTPVGIGANATFWAMGGAVNAPLAILGAAAQFSAGRLLSNPRFTRWLAKTPSEPRAIRPHVARLSAIAESNPAMSDDILGLQQRLLESLGQPGRLAAEQNVNDVRPQPPQKQ